MRIAVVVAALTAPVLTACGGSEGVRLVVRTDLPDGLLEFIEESFEARQPDVDLRFSEGSVQETLAELQEGEADFHVWMGAPASALLRADVSGALAASPAGWAPMGEAETRGEDAASDGAPPTHSPSWQPWMTTPLVIAFDRTVVALSDAPTDWIDLLHHAWFEDVRVPDPAATEAGAVLVGGMVVQGLRDEDDLDRGFDWLARLHDQVDAYVIEPRAAVEALGRGDALLAIMTRADAETARGSDAEWLHYRIPVSGTPEAVLGVAIVAGSSEREAALAFLDHLGSDAVATAAKLHTHWEPVAGRVDESGLPPDFELPQSWRGFTPAFDTLAVELDGWVDRWEREIRPR